MDDTAVPRALVDAGRQQKGGWVGLRLVCQLSERPDVLAFQADDNTTTNLGKTSYIVGSRGSNYPQRFQIL